MDFDQFIYGAGRHYCLTVDERCADVLSGGVARINQYFHVYQSVLTVQRLVNY